MAQQPPNAAIVAFNNYREFYSQEAQAGDPDPAQLMTSYRFMEVAGGAERPTPAYLKEQTFAFGERSPLTFLCLMRQVDTSVEVHVLHRMMRYFELPNATGGRGMDLSMGVLGDVRAAQVPVVEVDNTVFSLIGAGGVRVPTVAVMPDLLAAAPPGTFLGPYAPDAPDTELVRPRLTQVIPKKYAAHLVHRDGVSPVTAYQELLGMFTADGVLGICADVLTWLRVACTSRGGATDLAALPAVAHNFPLLLLPATTSEYVASKVATDLPGRHRGPGPAAAPTLAIEQVATAVTQLAATVVAASSSHNVREPKGVMDAYRETFPVLLRYCHVATVGELPPLWNRLARGSKGEQQSVIQQELTRVCVGRGLTPDLYCPAVTTGLKQMVSSLNFAGNGPDDLAAGCQPFLVVYTSQNDHYRALDNATVANQLDQGTANASLADIREIREKEKVRMPCDLNQVSLTLQRYAILVSALFQGPGATNPFVQCVWLLASAFHDRLPLYLGQFHALTGTPWAGLYPAHVLRHVQVNVYEYLQALQVGGSGDAVVIPELPTFKDLLRDLQRGAFHLSSSWLPLPVSMTVDPSTMPASTGASVVTRSTRASTTASTVSALTAATGGARTTSAGTQGTFVTNPARDAEFDALQLRGQMRDLLRAHPPPANDAGDEFCVSWWGRGGCYSNCGRSATHRPFANPAERSRLLTHVRAHLVVPAVAAAGSSA
jgi:hypothetical protein